MNALYRFTGSLAFVGAARAAYIVFKDKKDSDRRYFMPVKNNLGIDDSGFSYHVAADDQNRAFIQWDGELVTEKLEDLLSDDDDDGGPGAKIDTAKDWLVARLSNGPVPSEAIFAETMRAGITKYALRAAKTELNKHARSG